MEQTSGAPPVRAAIDCGVSVLGGDPVDLVSGEVEGDVPGHFDERVRPTTLRAALLMGSPGTSVEPRPSNRWAGNPTLGGIGEGLADRRWLGVSRVASDRRDLAPRLVGIDQERAPMGQQIGGRHSGS